MSQNNFPELIIPLKSEIESWGKKIIDASVDIAFTKGREAYIDPLYDSYNGITSGKEFNFVEKAYGIESRTKMIHYRFARSKMKIIENEFLKVGFNATVATVNRRAIIAKKEKVDKIKMMSTTKPILEKMPEVGINPFDGMNIPDANDPTVQKKINDKSMHEKAMQYIIDKKRTKEGLRKKFSKNVVDIICTCECFNKVERGPDGITTIRTINPKDAIYLESIDDDLLYNTPIKGERRLVYLNDVLQYYSLELNNNSELLKKVTDHFQQTGEKVNDIRKINGMNIDYVYIVEAKVMKVQYYKEEYSNDSDETITTRLSSDEYEKNKKQYQYKERTGKCKIKKIEKETLYEFHRLGEDIYLRMEEAKDKIYESTTGFKKKVAFNYTGLLSGTVNGVRVPLQALIHNLDAAYDIIMFQLMREINKIKGKVFIYDEAFKPKDKNINKVLNDILENNIILINSAQDGVGDVDDAQKLLQQLREIDLGASETLNALILVKQDIEASVERITGINPARQGLTQASSKVGNNEMNLDASRSITYDIFFNINEYIELTLMKICEKTKIDYLMKDGDDPGLLLGDEQYGFIKLTKEFAWDSYATYISDGRKEQEIKERLRSLYDVQINSGELRASDVAKAEMHETFIEYIETLETAWETIQTTRQKEKMAIEQEKTKQTEMMIKSQEADREDKQQHDKDLVQLQGEINKEIQLLKQAFVQSGIISKEKLGLERDKVKEKNNQENQDSGINIPNFAQ